MKNELNTYTRPGALFRNTGIGEVFSKLDKMEIIENVFLLLLCRICFMGYLVSPFGVAYFAAVFLKRRRPAYVLCAVIGILSVGYTTFSFKYGGTILIIAAISAIFSKELSGKKIFPALICSGALFINGMIYVIAEGFFAYDTLLLLAECGGACLSYFAFDKLVLLVRTSPRRRIFESAETISLVILCGTVVLSVALIDNMLPFAHVLAITVILALSVSCGFSVSCPAGVVFGLCLGIASVYPPQTVCIYCLSALASGFVKRYGKFGAAAAFAVTSFAATMLMCPESNGIITVSYVALATLILLFIPDKFLNRFGALAIKAKEEAAAGDRIRNAVETKMTQTINSIDSVSVVFRDVLDSLLEQNGETHGVIFDNTADTVCKKCTLCKFCWNKNRDDTLSYMNAMYKTMERKNSISKHDVPQEFSDMCIRCEPFVSELNKNYEAYKITRMWAGRVMESKRLVAEQFNNISMILKNMKTSLAEQMNCEPELEHKIATALDRRGISANKINVSAGDGFTVTMDKVSCGRNLVCSTTVAAAVSEVLEVPMLRENRECSDDVCHLKFSQQTRFVTDIAVASATRDKSSGSGDVALSFPCGNGKTAVILSDGMGSGEKAHFQSSITAQLAKNLLSAGFDKETCVRLINNILMMNADRDTFATIDLCIVNLYTGSMEFVKTGAANSYIKTASGSETVYASSLPAGLVQGLEPDYDMRYMKSGDYLIMASDGITDVLDSPDHNEIFDIAEGFTGSAKVLADNILNAALSYTDGIAYDDMTVAVCAVSENM